MKKDGQGNLTDTENSLAELTLTDIKTNADTEAKTTTQVMVKAVLCWSEYYNGKWQPTRTSDINEPAELGAFDAAGYGAFDRSRLSINKFETHPKVVIEFVYDNILKGQFTLYNTHSLPQLTIQYIYNIPSRYLAFNYSNWVSSLHIKYNFDNRLDMICSFSYLSRVRTIDHMYGWKFAPFFFEDRNHVFYVITDIDYVPIPKSDIFVVEKEKPILVDTPSLVMEEPWAAPPAAVEAVEKLVQEYIGSGGPYGGDYSNYIMNRFVTEDANIHQAINFFRTVPFGEKVIGPAGTAKTLQKSMQNRGR